MQKYGFIYRMLGKDHYLIEEIPTGFTEASTKEFFANLGKQKIEKDRERIKQLFLQKRVFVPTNDSQVLLLIEELGKYEPRYLLDKGKKVICEFDDRLMERIFL